MTGNVVCNCFWIKKKLSLIGLDMHDSPPVWFLLRLLLTRRIFTGRISSYKEREKKINELIMYNYPLCDQVTRFQSDNLMKQGFKNLNNCEKFITRMSNRRSIASEDCATLHMFIEMLLEASRLMQRTIYHVYYNDCDCQKSIALTVPCMEMCCSDLVLLFTMYI